MKPPRNGSRAPFRRGAAAGLLALAGAFTAVAARADDQLPLPSRTDAAPPVALTGTLAKAAATGSLAIGYRDASLPFSFLGSNGQPVGYSIDICRELVRAAEAQVRKPLAIRWVPVTSDTRMGAVTSGQVDLECGSTTANAEREREVAFSPVFFIAGTRLLVPAGSPIRGYRDLGGKRVVVTAGTTNEKVLRELLAKNRLAATVTAARDHADAFAQLAAGQADAMANDDVLLAGFAARARAQRPNNAPGFRVVGDLLSYDPYGIMFRKNDPQLAQLVNAAFRRMAADGDLQRLYERWFLKPLPGGLRMNVPMSPQLQATIDTLAVGTAQ